jgi:D-threo-aldose 1-dehydrogenase
VLNVIFGTAHLFGVVAPRDSGPMLDRAYDCGLRHFDTAPSYGYGDTEPAVGALRATAEREHEHIAVTTKVGSEPPRRPGPAVRTAKWAARRLPAQYQQRLRPARPAGTGRFSPADVSMSVERSLRRLGRIDRLLLHEIRPDEITDELLACLNRYRERNDVGQLGVATFNDITGACLDRAGDTFEVAHIAVWPGADPVSLPPFVTTRVGHGLLGPAGAGLRDLTAGLRNEPELAEFWDATVAGTRWQGPTGLSELLLARAKHLDLTDVIVATSRPQRLTPTLELFGADLAIDESVLGALNHLIQAVDLAGPSNSSGVRE